MRIRHLPPVVFAAVVLAALSFADALSAEGHASYQVENGIAVYLGVVPAAMIQGHPKGHPEQAMHGGLPRGRHAYHVMAAVFDATSGERISDATIEARVAPLGLAGSTRVLESMRIAETVTYGNYFAMPDPGRYRIVFSINLPGADKPIVMEFAYVLASH